MKSVQQESQPTFKEMLRMGIPADEIGAPQPWSALICKATKGDLACTDKLLVDIDKPTAQNYLVRVAERELQCVDFSNYRDFLK